MVRNYVHAAANLIALTILREDAGSSTSKSKYFDLLFNIVGAYLLWVKFCAAKIFLLSAWNSLDEIVSALTLLRSWLSMS